MAAGIATLLASCLAVAHEHSRYHPAAGVGAVLQELEDSLDQRHVAQHGDSPCEQVEPHQACSGLLGLK